MYDLERSGVAKFFSQQTIFITGATGTLGRERLEELLKADIFDSLPQHAFERLSAVEGDLTKPLMNLSTKDVIELRSDITVAIHLAAAARTLLLPSTQIHHNVFGLEQFLRICEGMVHARAVLVHSTVFAQVDRRLVEEKLYPTLTGVMEISREAVHDPQSLDSRLASCHEQFFSAFNFSKHLAEHLLVDCQLPVVLLRTGHFSSAVHDPYPGWYHNTGPILRAVQAIDSGLVSSMTCSTGNALTVVPIDMAANAALLATWRRSLISERGCRVCHCAPSSDALISWGAFIRLVVEVSQRLRGSRVAKTPWMLLTPFPVITLLMFIIIDTAYALLCDARSIFDLRMPSHFRQVSANYHSLKDVSRETRVSCVAQARNMELLVESLSDIDQALFDTKMNELSWRDYVEVMVRGCRPPEKRNDTTLNDSE